MGGWVGGWLINLPTTHRFAGHGLCELFPYGGKLSFIAVYLSLDVVELVEVGCREKWVGGWVGGWVDEEECAFFLRCRLSPA